MTTSPKPTLEEMIVAAAKLPPGPAAWAPIFEAYPDVTPEALARKFREAGERAKREADELQAYASMRRLKVIAERDGVVVTEEELAQWIFVPGGGGRDGGWKKLGDCTPRELERVIAAIDAAHGDLH